MQNITPHARSVAASHFGCSVDDLEVIGVSGGYSRNRRSLAGYQGEYIFVKEVDTELLSDDGTEELGWLRKDYEIVRYLKSRGFDSVSDWCELSDDGRVLLLPSFRSEDGWLWGFPEAAQQQAEYVDAVIAATKRLEEMQLTEEMITGYNLQPFLRDEVGLDEGLHLIRENTVVRERTITKLQSMLDSGNHETTRPELQQLINLLNDTTGLDELFAALSELMSQPSDKFGHCDVRSDNIAYHPVTKEVRFVDWNWASLVPTNFGATEFLIDARRRGVDVTPWIEYFNQGLLAASVGFWLRRCLKDPLQQGSDLREMQAESAAMAYSMYRRH